MKIQEIPADEVVVMTEFLHRAFNAAGCDPRCHCCRKMIPVENQFKLSTIDETKFKFGEGNNRKSQLKIPTGEISSKEVMLCENCDAKTYQKEQKKMFKKNRVEYEAREKARKESGGGCFRINGKVVI